MLDADQNSVEGNDCSKPCRHHDARPTLVLPHHMSHKFFLINRPKAFSLARRKLLHHACTDTHTTLSAPLRRQHLFGQQGKHPVVAHFAAYVAELPQQPLKAHTAALQHAY
jgi:hypothetical protein